MVRKNTLFQMLALFLVPSLAWPSGLSAELISQSSVLDTRNPPFGSQALANRMTTAINAGGGMAEEWRRRVKKLLDLTPADRPATLRQRLDMLIREADNKYNVPFKELETKARVIASRMNVAIKPLRRYRTGRAALSRDILGLVALAITEPIDIAALAQAERVSELMATPEYRAIKELSNDDWRQYRSVEEVRKSPYLSGKSLQSTQRRIIDLEKAGLIRRREIAAWKKPMRLIVEGKDQAPSDEEAIWNGVDPSHLPANKEFRKLNGSSLLEALWSPEALEDQLAQIQHTKRLTREEAWEFLAQRATEELLAGYEVLRNAAKVPEEDPTNAAMYPKIIFMRMATPQESRVLDPEALKRGFSWMEDRGIAIRRWGDRWWVTGLAAHRYLDVDISHWPRNAKQRWESLTNSPPTCKVVLERIRLILEVNGILRSSNEFTRSINPLFSHWARGEVTGEHFDIGLEKFALALGIEPVLLRTGRTRAENERLVLPTLHEIDSPLKRIEPLRRLAGLSNRLTAQLTGRTIGSVKEIERGTLKSLDIEHWPAFASAFDIDPFYLISGVPEKDVLSRAMDDEGSRARDIRLSLGLSEYRACERLGISYPLLQEWESFGLNGLTAEEYIHQLRTGKDPEKFAKKVVRRRHLDRIRETIGLPALRLIFEDASPLGLYELAARGLLNSSAYRAKAGISQWRAQNVLLMLTNFGYLQKHEDVHSSGGLLFNLTEQARSWAAQNLKSPSANDTLAMMPGTRAAKLYNWADRHKLEWVKNFAKYWLAPWDERVHMWPVIEAAGLYIWEQLKAGVDLSKLTDQEILVRLHDDDRTGPDVVKARKDFLTLHPSFLREDHWQLLKGDLKGQANLSEAFNLMAMAIIKILREVMTVDMVKLPWRVAMRVVYAVFKAHQGYNREATLQGKAIAMASKITIKKIASIPLEIQLAAADAQVTEVLQAIAHSRRFLALLKTRTLTILSVSRHSSLDMQKIVTTLSNRHLFTEDHRGQFGLTPQGQLLLDRIVGAIPRGSQPGQPPLAAHATPQPLRIAMPLYCIDAVSKSSRVIPLILRRADHLENVRQVIADDLASWLPTPDPQAHEKLVATLRLPQTKNNADELALLANYWIAYNAENHAVGYVVMPTGTLRIGAITRRPDASEMATRYPNLHRILLGAALKIKLGPLQSSVIISRLHPETAEVIRTAVKMTALAGGSVELGFKQAQILMDLFVRGQMQLKEQYAQQLNRPSPKSKSRKISRALHSDA